MVDSHAKREAQVIGAAVIERLLGDGFEGFAVESEVTLPGEPTIDLGGHECWGRWSALLPPMTGDYAVPDRVPRLAVTLEYSAYWQESPGDEEDWSPVDANAVALEVGVVLPVPLGRQLPAAREHVRNALRGCVPRAEQEVFPNCSPLREGLYHLMPRGRETLEDGVWVVARSETLTFPAGTGSAALDPLIATVVGLLPLLRRASAVAAGAIHGTSKLTREVVLGWLGELHLDQEHPELSFGPSWFANYDMRDEEGRPVEVKSTVRDRTGEAHFSSGELALALAQRERYRLALVEVDAAAVADVYGYLTAARGGGAGASPKAGLELPEAALRLVEATGLTHAEVESCWGEIERRCAGDDWATSAALISDPVGWLAPVSADLHERKVGIRVPWGSFGGGGGSRG